MMKRLLMALTLTTLIVFTSSSAWAITQLGEFSYWYSDSAKIGYLSNSSNVWGLARTTNCGMTDANFISYASSGVSAWNLSSYSFSNGTYDSAALKMQCVSRSEANGMGIPSNAGAATSWSSSTLTAAGTYAGSTKNVYSIGGYQMYLIWDTSSTSTNTSNLSATKWQNIFAHEHGHGIGYAGHNTTDSTQLMYPYVGTMTTPQTNDKHHMSNLYTIN